MEEIAKNLVFKVKHQLFTLGVGHVDTIIQLPKVFKVPQAPAFIIGVINVEGDVIPIIDTGIKLGMAAVDQHEKSQVIILQMVKEEDRKRHRLGFLVDDVNDVVDINPRKIQALPTSKYEFDTRLVDGMHKVNEDFAMQINVGNFFKGEIEELLETQKQT